MLTERIRYVLINPRKRMSYVAHRKKVTKDDVIAWGISNGFKPPVRTRSRPGYDKRQREDLADAFVCGRIARDLWTHIQAASLPKTGDIILDRNYGLAYRSDLLFNLTALGSR